MYETQYSYFINPATKKFLQMDEAHSPITTPPSFYFGDRPTFTLSFPANTISAGDYLVAVLDNENRFLDTKQATGLNPVMTGVLHEVTSAEAGAQSLEIQLFNYSKKFADVINGHDNAVTCLFTVYLKSMDGEGNFTFTELGQTIANGEPTVTSPECIWDDLPVTKYYTREELDAIYNQFLAGVSLVVEYSNLAKSYAVGGTGTREGEDEDNARYYAEMASQAANAVSTMYEAIQRLATQVANTKEYIDGLVESMATDIRDISEIAASVTATAAQVSRDAQSVRQAKSSIDASVQFVTQAKSTIENLASQVSQNAVAVSNDKDSVAQLASQVSNAASQVARDKADAKGYAESAASTLTQVQAVQTDVTQKQSAVTTMKNTIQGWYNQISSWYNSINAYMEQMLGWWTDVDTWQQQVSEDKAVVVSSKDTAVQAKNDAVAAKTAAETAQEKAETAQEKAEAAQDAAEDARDEAVSTLANKRDILQTLVTSSSTALVAEAGKSYNWTVSAASTIALAAADKVAGKETRIDIYIDLQDGGSVTGDGVAVADAVLQSGWYKLIWDGTNATLYSTKAGGAEAVITIPSSSTSYSLQDNKHYQQVPDNIPTYTLPTASFDGLVHEITVLVDFMHVTSCSFVDAGGVPVTLQSAISPQVGEAYVFRCYWYGKWRVVPLKIRNAATATSSNGVVEVSDAVAGDALSLKMVAPRSVVVNQFITNGDFSDSTNGWGSNGCTTAVSSGVLTATITSVSTSMAVSTRQLLTLKGVTNHIYVITYELNPVHNSTTIIRIRVGDAGASSSLISTAVTANTWNKCGGVFTADRDFNGIILYPVSGSVGNWSVNDTFQVRNIQIVDLTQYFNGDTTLINSITSWDDLVAYDPRFASYVEYNTGTVTGVQPTVKVTGKNLFNKNAWHTITRNNGESKLVNGFYAKAGQTYALTVDTTASTKLNYVYLGARVGDVDVAFSDVESQGGSNTITTTSWTTFPKIMTFSKDVYVYFYRASAGANWSDASSANTNLANVQIELGSVATAYEPYHDGGTAQAPAPLFAVGNAADEFEAVSGVTTSKIGKANLGNLTWTYYSPDTSHPYGFFVSSNISNKAIGVSIGEIVFCDKYIYNQSFNKDKVIFGNAGGKNLYIVDNAYNDGAVLKTALADVFCYYTLATPTTSQSTPTQISLQAGNNTAMQTDGGRTLAELAMTYENLPAAD